MQAVKDELPEGSSGVGNHSRRCPAMWDSACHYVEKCVLPGTRRSLNQNHQNVRAMIDLFCNGMG